MHCRIAAYVAALIAALAVAAFAAEPVTVVVAGKTLSDPQPFLDGDVVVVGLRNACDALGATIKYNAAAGQYAVRAANGDLLILRDGKRDLLIGDRHIALERPLDKVNDRCRVPAKPILEALGARVFWEPDRRLLVALPKLEDIVVRAGGGGASVEVTATAPVQFQQAALTDPPRVYIDLVNATLPEGREPGVREIAQGGVQSVRWGGPDGQTATVRVVLDLAGDATHRVQQLDGRRALVTVGSPPANAAIVARFRPQVLAVETQQHDGLVDVVVLLTDPTPTAQDVLRGPLRVVVDLPEAALDTRQTQAAGDGQLIRGIRLGQLSADGAVRIVLDMNALMAFSIVEAQDPPRFAIRFRPEPLASKRIVVDPGHGGHDPGAHGRTLREKDLNLDLALRLRRIMQDYGVQPILTRSDDTFVDLYGRPQMANQLQADIFLSIHHNAWARPNGASGTETYYWRSKDKCLATVMHEHLLTATGRKDNGVRRGNYAVLRESRMPAALVEVAYINYDEEERLLAKEDYRQHVAQSLFDGLRQYVEGPTALGREQADATGAAPGSAVRSAER
jgi:N-acetylmuramoyl-L-alanine amidase